jgi:uncharacterized membrane protein YbhN (UPF0104 family)
VTSRSTQASWVKWVRITGTILSLGLLVWLVTQQDWDAFLTTLQKMRWELALLAAVLVLVTQTFNATRWFTLLRAIGLSTTWLRSIQIFFAGLYVSNFLPTTIGGDVLRLSGIAAETDEGVNAGATVIIDRLVSLAGMALLLPFSFIYLVPAIGGAATLAAPGYVMGLSWFDSIRPRMRKVWEAFALWKGKPGALAAAWVVSLAGVLSYLVSLLLLAHELDINVSLAQVAGVTGLTYFMTLLPISLNGWGVREVGVVAFYTTLGAGADQAVALALVSRALLMIASLPGAFWVGSVLESLSSQAAKLTPPNEDS